MKKAFFSALFFIYSVSGFTQYWPPLFSVTGDTVCYSDGFGQTVSNDSSLVSYTIHILQRGEKNIAKEIASFDMVCRFTNTCLEELNKDTLKKYHLQYTGDGASLWFNKDFVITTKLANTHVIDTAAFGAKYIYQTTLTINISCKNKQLYIKTFDAMFKGDTPNDFRQDEFISINAWRKKNTRIYFVSFYIKEFQTHKKPGNVPDYNSTDFKFIIPQ